MFRFFSGSRSALLSPVPYIFMAVAALPLAACAGDQGHLAQQSTTEQPESSAAPLGYAQLDESGNVMAVSPARPGNSHYGDYLVGLSAQWQFDLKNAATHWQRALMHDPDNLELMVETFRLMTAEGEQTEALRLAERVIERRNDMSLARLVQAVGKADQDDWAGADEDLSLIQGKGLLPLVVPLERAWVLLGKGDLEQAQAELDKVNSEKALRQMKLLHRALIYDVAGASEQAATAYEEALKESPTALRLVQLAGNFYSRHGKTERARIVYLTFLESNPETILVQPALDALERGEIPKPMVVDAKQGLAAVLFDLASLLSAERAQRLALMHAHMALWLDPELHVGHVLIGEVLQRVQRPAEAIAAYRKIPESSPFFWTVRLRIAEELVALQRTEEAISELKALSAEQPDNFEPLYRLGNLLRAEERFTEAVTVYNSAEERLPELLPRYWSLYYFRGIALERSKQWDLAEKDFKRALELQPNQPFVMNYLAYSWVDQEINLEEAEQMLIKAVDLRPDDGYIVDSLGWAYFRLGRYDEAVDLLERAVSLRAEDPVINDHLGDAYWRTGRRREARVQWRRSLSLEPEEDQAVMIEEKIKSGLPNAEKDI
ncbi:tetratricopeptide repeat protein [Rhodovibrionaceae bacterium A322]